MDIGSYIEKLKTLCPSSVAMPAGVSSVLAKISLPPIIQEKWEILDKRFLLLSSLCITGIYLSLFIYTSLNAQSSIKELESKMAMVSVEIVEKEIKPPILASDSTPASASKRHLGQPAPQPDIAEHEMSKANLLEGLSLYDQDVGRLPIIRVNDHLTSFRAYQKQVSLRDIGEKPAISFMLKDYGLSDKNSNIALDILPPNVSFLLSPYALLPQEWINRARAAGHEVWLELHVQHGEHNDGGLNMIYHHDSLHEKGNIMRLSLAQALGYVGVAFFMDKEARNIQEHYKKLIEELYGRGLGIFEMNPLAPSFIEAMSITKAAPYIKASGEITPLFKKDIFAPIENIAQKRGEAIMLVPPYPDFMKDLTLWIEKIGRIDYAFLPVSAIYDVPLARAGALDVVPD